MALRVLIVDDSDTTRRILRNVIRSQFWDVSGEAENGWSGVKKFQELRPDVVIIDRHARYQRHRTPQVDV
jgi:two-component system chemotaxis response regulator CheY